MNKEEARETTRMRHVMDLYGCNSEEACRYLDLRDEGHGQYQAAVMAGLADPHDSQDFSAPTSKATEGAKQ